MDKDVIKAWLANGSVLAVVTWAEAEQILKVVLLAVTVAYTIFKFVQAARGKPFKED